MLTVITIFLTAITLLGILFSPLIVRLFASGFADTPGKVELAATLNRIMFPYIFLISMSALAMGILNSFHRFEAPAMSPIVLNLTMIAFSFLGSLFGDITKTLAVGVGCRRRPATCDSDPGADPNRVEDSIQARSEAPGSSARGKADDPGNFRGRNRSGECSGGIRSSRRTWMRAV
jgi:hypothetical protein